MNSHPNRIRFGDLLVKLELISERELQDALQVAPQFGLPLGRTLVLSGRMTEAELQLAVELQPLINQKNYPIDSAKNAARLVRKDGLSASEALRKIGIKHNLDEASLGSILMQAGVITQPQLNDAKRTSYETGMRLGRMLILNGAITHPVLTAALEFQGMVREKRLSLQQAVALLSGEAAKHSSLPLNLEAHGMKPAPAKKQVRFGEFLVLSGLATEAEILNAMETSYSKQLSLGEAIVKLGLVSERVFDKAVQLHNKVCSGETTLPQATAEIHKLVFGFSPHEKMMEQTHSPVLGELLKMTGFVNDSDIVEAIELSNRYPSLIGKMLVVSGAIDEATLIASLRCQYLLKHGIIELDDAVRALQYSKTNKASFDDALEDLGIRKPAS